MKVFIDTNVMIDYLENRQPFATDAIRIFELAAMRRISLYVSDLTIANVRYITRKKISLTDYYRAMLSLMEFIHVTSIGECSVQKALELKANDFEDALQYYSAKNAGMDMIVTRNASDYSFAEIPLFTPSEFLRYVH